jgi:crossover junction endodeoxyribonuclease RusA
VSLSYSLPWPPKDLSPNARLHWRSMARAKKAYKAACAWELFQTPTPWVEPPNGRIPIAITIAPPDNRRRDRDNIQSSLKYALDELANHLGVDDYLFDPSYRFADPVKGGRITVEVAG